MTELELKYGCNPNQKPARIFMESGELPLEVLNGRPGYINFMDALNSWQLVKALKQATGLPAAASFKHVSPAGAALGLPLNDTERLMYLAPQGDLSPIACAYIRARGADRLCSFGDWAALSDPCDGDTARFLALEVSDGVIAPDYTDEALEILKTKRKGGYNVVKIDPNYTPAPVERRNIFGITFEQGYNDLAIDQSMLNNLVTQNKDLHPPGREQGGHLVAAAAPQGAFPPLPGERPPPRPGQRYRRLYRRRPHSEGKNRVDCQIVRRHPGLRRLLPLWGQCGAGPAVGRGVYRPARRLHPGRSGH